MKYYEETEFTIKTGNENRPTKTIRAITPAVFNQIIIDSIRECGIDPETVRSNAYTGREDSLDRYIEIESAWANGVTVYVRDNWHFGFGKERVYAEDEAKTEIRDADLNFEVSWSATSRTIGCAMNAVASYQRAINLAATIEARMQQIRHYWCPKTEEETK